jgi:hypothetical protein
MAASIPSLIEAQRGRLLESVLKADRRAGLGRRQLFEMTLDGGDRLTIIDVLLTVLQGVYCHLPQKRAGFAIDPLQQLRLLRIRAGAMSEPQFHMAITSIVTGLRDAHTRYSGPLSMQGCVAVLPFLVEQYGPTDDARFIVSKVSDPELIGDPKFRASVILETWNGIPFPRAVELHADQETGGRPDARLARALDSLTSRPLEFGPPPDEMWVDVGYRSGNARREVRIPWRVVRPRRAANASRPGSRASRNLALDHAAEQVRRAKKLLFSGALWTAEHGKAPPVGKSEWLSTTQQDFLSARPVTPGDGKRRLGYLRIWSFDVEDDQVFLDEVIRLLALLPQEGLIIDLRNNPGGLIWAAERMLQLLTPNTITPTRFALVATPVTRAMAQSPFNRLELEPWVTSLETALATGEVYSQPLPMTDPAWCNDLGQHYSGPVACIVDANTYSSGDLFTAGFVDNGIGPVIAVGEATGAGGANVWTAADISDALADTPFTVDSLPDGVQYSMAVRRATRSGAAEGVPIEDLGIAGLPYAMTADDLLHDNRDLLAFCRKQFEGTEVTAMSATTDSAGITVTTAGLDTLEYYIDDLPAAPATSISDGLHHLAVPRAARIEVIGRKARTVRQRRLLTIS